MAGSNAASLLESEWAALDRSWSDDENKPVFHNYLFKPMLENAEICDQACDGAAELLDGLEDELKQLASQVGEV